MIGRIVSILAICALSVPALGHESSFTHIDVKIDGNDVLVTLALNQSDLLERVLGLPHDRGRFVDRTEFEDAASRVLAYVIANLPATANGKALPAPAAIDWPPQRVELTRVDSTGLEVPSVIPLTLRYNPPPGTRVTIEPKLFAAPDFSAKFDVRIERGAGSKPITMVLEKHEPIELESTHADGETGRSFGLVWLAGLGLVVTILVWRITIRRRPATLSGSGE